MEAIRTIEQDYFWAVFDGSGRRAGNKFTDERLAIQACRVPAPFAWEDLQGKGYTTKRVDVRAALKAIADAERALATARAVPE
jgi:hypothetical protein